MAFDDVASNEESNRVSQRNAIQNETFYTAKGYSNAFINILWNSNASRITSLLISAFLLTGSDLKLLFASKEYDGLFDVFFSICVAGLIIEMSLYTYKVPFYALSLYFFMDVVALTSVTLNFSYVHEALEKAIHLQPNGGNTFTTYSKSFSYSSLFYFRVFRLMRLAQIFALKKRTDKTKYHQDYELSKVAPDAQDLHDGWKSLQHIEKAPAVLKDDDTNPILPSSKFRSRLTELTTQRGFIFAVLLVIFVPFFEPNYYIGSRYSAEYGLDQIIQGAAGVHFAKDEAVAYDIYVRTIKTYLNSHNSGGRAMLQHWDDPELVWVQLPLDLSDYSPAKFTGEQGCYSYLHCAQPMLHLPIETISRLLSKEAVDQGVPITPNFDPVSSLRFIELIYATGTYCELDGIIEISEANPEGCLSGYRRTVTMMFDRRSTLRMGCTLNLARTALLVVLFVAGTIYVDREAKLIILEPIERLIERMDKIRRNPLAAVTIGKNQVESEVACDGDAVTTRGSDRISEAMSTEEAVASFKEKKSLHKKISRFLALPKKAPLYETSMFENAINKMLGLLALGFGEAGAGIIAKNIENSQGGLNALVKGRRINAIFGFCDIRQFTVATEILKEKVMVFVNQIAETVHATVDEYNGSPNKNIGDAFLVVWKLSSDSDNDDLLQEQQAHSSKLIKMADMALLAFLKIIARINRSPILENYETENLQMLQRISPDLRVHMGFGLHVGWAIEGAIGSKYKIDASYLSPNVNIASRLEAATKQYGVHLLLSQALYESLSPKAQQFCRQIDRVILKGSREALAIYTVDLDPSRLSTNDMPQNPLSMGSKEKQKERHEPNHFNIGMLLENDQDIAAMRSHISEEFYPTFRTAYANYEAGEWKLARELLLKTQYLKGNEDGPSTTLLHYMRQFDFVAPASWLGYRVLTEK